MRREIQRSKEVKIKKKENTNRNVKLRHAVRHDATVLTASLLLQQQTFPYSFSFIIYTQFVEIDS